MSASSAVTLPFWFQVLLGIIAILGFLGGSAFALFVIWPSIRRSNRVSDWIERDGKALVETLKGKVTLTGEPSNLSDFSQKQSGDPSL